MLRVAGLLMIVVSLTLFAGCASVKNSADISKYKELSAGGDQAATRALIDELRSPDRSRRDEAYKALIASGSPAVPELLKSIKDEDPEVREYAAAALGDIGDKRAVGPLLEMLKTEPKRRYVAAWALGKLKAEAAVDPLISALAEKNDALQKESTRALIAIGAPAVPALIKALDSADGDVRAYSARALGIIEDKRAEEHLIRHINDENTTVAAAAALALGTAGTEASVRPLIAALKAPDMMTRVNATISLGTLNAKDAVEPLTAIMDTDEDPYVREWSARALENITGNRYKYKDEHGMTVYPYNLYR